MKTLKTNKLTICCGNVFKFPSNKFDTFQDHFFWEGAKHTLFNSKNYFENTNYSKKNTVIFLSSPEDFHTTQDLRLLAREIGKAINEGYKIIVRTNNDYLIKELNILIQLYCRSKEKETPDELKLKDIDHIVDKICRDYQYTSKQFLNPENIIAYDYIKRIKLCKITEYGIEIPSMDNIINEMNNIEDNLLYQ